MRVKQLPVLLLALALGNALTAAAQTGRLAHLSHGGSAAALVAAERADNFGLPTHEYRYLKVTRLNDSLVLVDGQQRRYGSKEPWETLQLRQQSQWEHPFKSGVQLREYMQQRFPEARLVGFDSTTVSPPSRKKSNLELVLPELPGLLPGAGLLLLAGAGWLLAGRPRRVLATAAA